MVKKQASCLQGSAVQKVIHAFREVLHDEGIRYELLSDNTTLACTFSDGPYKAFQFIFQFDTDGKSVRMNVCTDIGIEEAKLPDCFAFCNTVNKDYRWIKLNVNAENELILTADAIIDCHTAGNVCKKLLSLSTLILDDILKNREASDSESHASLLLQSFTQRLERENILFSIDSQKNIIRIRRIGKHFGTLTFTFLFDAKGDSVTVTVFSIQKFASDLLPEAYAFCNKMNNKYRWIKLYIDKDNELTCACDAIIDGNNAGEICLILLRALVQLVDSICRESQESFH